MYIISCSFSYCIYTFMFNLIKYSLILNTILNFVCYVIQDLTLHSNSKQKIMQSFLNFYKIEFIKYMFNLAIYSIDFFGI